MTRRRDIPPPFVATSHQFDATSRQNVQNTRPFGLPTSACAAMSMETHPGGAGGAPEASGETTEDEVLGEGELLDLLSEDFYVDAEEPTT